MKETQDEDVNACWRQNSDDMRQRQKIHDVRHKTQHVEL